MMISKTSYLQRLIPLALLLAGLTCGGVAFGQDGKIGPFWEEHRSTHLDRLETRALIEKVCNERPGNCVEIRYGGPGEVNVMADSATHLAIREAIDAREPTKKTVTFKVSLLQASMKPLPAESARVSKENKATASELRAIADLKKLVPYREFGLLDATTMTTLNDAQGMLLMSGKARYETLLRIRPGGVADGSVTTDFRLRVASLMAHGLEKGTTVLSNSFNITPGDTVVVGSSKIGGDNAIVVLVTYLE
jgi:hypothetical protein